MKLFGSTKNKIAKDENSEKVSHLKVTEVVSVHCNIVNNHYHQLFCMCLFLINCLDNY